MAELLKDHSAELLVLVLTILVLGLLMPQLLKAYRHALEVRHTENMRILEQGQVLPHPDDRSRSAGRTAVLVPMVTIASAATVTCFLVAYRSEYLFSVALAVWSVAGVVSLAAITGGVALMGRLAHLSEEDEEVMEQPPEK